MWHNLLNGFQIFYFHTAPEIYIGLQNNMNLTTLSYQLCKCHVDDGFNSVFILSVSYVDGFLLFSLTLDV